MSDLVDQFLKENDRSVENTSMDQEIEMDAANIATYARGLAQILGEFNDELKNQGFLEEMRQQLVYAFFSHLVMDDSSANPQAPPDQGETD